MKSAAIYQVSGSYLGYMIQFMFRFHFHFFQRWTYTVSCGKNYRLIFVSVLIVQGPRTTKYRDVVRYKEFTVPLFYLSMWNAGRVGINSVIVLQL